MADAPQYSDLVIIFQNVTVNGDTIDISGVTSWRLCLGNDLTKSPQVVKTYSGVGGDFSMDAPTSSVSFFIDGSGLAASGVGIGPCYAALYPTISGKVVTHSAKFFNITPQLPRS